MSKKQSTMLLELEKAEIEQDVGTLFDSVMENLSIDYCVKETDFKHIFSSNKVLENSKQMSSPYMNVFDENDQQFTGKDAYSFPDGQK